MSTTLDGFEKLGSVQSGGRSNTFSKLNALKTLTVPATPPDNRVGIRFLLDGFKMIQVHNWVKIGDRNENILCKKTYGQNEKCLICDELGKQGSYRGIALVAILDNKENPVYEDISDADAEHYEDYAKVIDEKNITKRGDTLTISGVPQVRILNMGVQFWRNMEIYAEKYETICDRSYTIIRNGKGLETTYYVAPGDKDPEFKNPELLQLNFEPGLDFCISVEDYIKFLDRKSLLEKFEKAYVDGSGADNSVESTGNGEINLQSMLG